MLCNPRRMGLDAQALSLLHAQVYGVHVSRFAGKTAPSEMVVSKQDAGISFQCNPDNAQRLIKLALSELADLQVHFIMSSEISTVWSTLCLHSQSASAVVATYSYYPQLKECHRLQLFLLVWVYSLIIPLHLVSL